MNEMNEVIESAIRDAWRGVQPDDVATDAADALGSDDVPRLHATQLGVPGSAAYRARVREAYGDETVDFEVACGRSINAARIAEAALDWARRWLAANPDLGLRFTLRWPLNTRQETWTLREQVRS